MPANLENSDVLGLGFLFPRDWKRAVCIPIPKKGNAKEFSNDHTIALISHTSKFSSVQFSHSVVSDSL